MTHNEFVHNAISYTRTRILAYLGELKGDEFVTSKKLISDLNLRFTTAKNTLTTLEERGLVEKKISVDRGVAAHYRIDPEASTRGKVAFIPPPWSDSYGKHPHQVDHAD